MKNIIAALVCITFTFASQAQNPGYFNHKNVAEFSFNAQTPLFSNLAYIFGGDYFNKVQGTRFAKTRDNFDYGIRLAYMHTFKRNFGAGLEFGYDYFSVQQEPKTYYSGWDYGYLAFERTNVSSMMIMPKLEFSNKGSVLPMGISHQIGLGIRMVSPVDKQYYIANALNQNQVYYTPIEENPYKYKGKAVRGATLMYAVNMRTPLTKRLLLNYGLRYTLNFMSKADYYEKQEAYDNPGPELLEPIFRDLVRKRKQLSFIQASIGLSFAF